ncbi:serine/threonine protein kinase [Parabacteroides sp. PFB2-12]|uniref:serine/threonine protein kinase n=1 Tax=unclassified Parabacteroides TaxID=2649774 RepID=UPI0024738A99|nr:MULTISPECIES: serine/threonine-protein kinase [unclassified Parabacteroides]MDH6343695.1 serine/threonine protein kinase [Parabacteroides sp. PM6-13]MDH6391331.1 serine/threonine protein kinase [Parabacteroides sp. PFB2-12]
MNLPYGHLLQNGKYRLTHVVGQGGFGITYKGVWNTEVKGSLGTVDTEVPIAIKEYFFKDYCYRDTETNEVKVHSETGNNLFHKFKEKLIKEARILSDVHHPHIVNVLEVFEENNTAYIVMEFISGLSLKEMMERDGVMSENRVLRYIHQIGEALQFVHDKNILHLDIKPSNILIDQRDNARLIDFGVSKRYDTEQQETSTTMLTLSKGFASIEQYDNEGTQVFSPYPDIYSLGASLYNLLTGKIPVESILRATRPMTKPTVINKAISAKTEGVILKAMEIVPTDRYQTVREMMSVLDKPSEEACSPTDATRTTGTNIGKGGDTTLLFPTNTPEQRIGDTADQTILNTPQEEIKKPKGKKRKVIMTAVFAVIALVASAVIYTLYIQKGPQTTMGNDSPSTTEQTTEIENPAPAEETENTPVSTPENTSGSPQTTSQTGDNEEKAPVNEPQRDQEKIVSEPIEQPGTPTTTEESASLLPSKEELNATISALIASANKKMLQSDFKGAEDDYTEAYKLSLDDNLLDQIKEASKKAEEKDIEEKKAQYKTMMTIGHGELTVVKKISTGKIGAINNAGMEIIPCKYLVADWHEEGRAFQREDMLYDIYDENGKLVREGVIL